MIYKVLLILFALYIIYLLITQHKAKGAVKDVTKKLQDRINDDRNWLESHKLKKKWKRRMYRE